MRKTRDAGMVTDGYTNVPNELLLNPWLTGAEHRVLMTLISFAWRTEGSRASCFPSMGSLVLYSNLTETTVRRALRGLKEIGAVEWQVRSTRGPKRRSQPNGQRAKEGEANLYHINFDVDSWDISSRDKSGAEKMGNYRARKIGDDERRLGAKKDKKRKESSQAFQRAAKNTKQLLLVDDETA